jgi:hypothetical protein
LDHQLSLSNFNAFSHVTMNGTTNGQANGDSSSKRQFQAGVNEVAASGSPDPPSKRRRLAYISNRSLRHPHSVYDGTQESDSSTEEAQAIQELKVRADCHLL